MIEKDICRMPTTGTESLGGICGGCGHTTLVHPGVFTNPSLHECPVCRLLFVIDQAKANEGEPAA